MTKKVSMRDKFPANQIGKLPKPTKAQTDKVKANFKEGMRCKVCKGWHHKDVIHLDYVGHAPLTDRMLDVDASWNWEPLATTEQGLPLFDAIGGLWIKLTIDGVTRIGYGNAAKGTDGNREKEVIGDALRNAAMRFGAALDLWHKGELHVEEIDINEPKAEPKAVEMPTRASVNKYLAACKTDDEHKKLFDGFVKKYGESALGDSTGHKNETWEQLFSTHFNRVNKINPTLPNPLQDSFDSMVNDCSSLEDYNAIADLQDANEALQIDGNFDIVLNLKREYT